MTSSTIYDYSVPGTINVTDENGNTTEYQFTDKGDLLQVTDALNRVVQLTYDEAGNVTEVIAPDATRSQFTHDAQGRVLSRTDPLNQTTSFNYTGVLETPTAVTDARGNKLTYTYDSLGNVTSIGYEDGSSEQFVYDETGLLVQQIERSGDTFDYDYDRRGRLTQKNYDDGTFEAFTYDSQSNLTSVQDVNRGITTLAYDENNQVTQITYPTGRFLAYTYDADGRRVSMMAQDGFEVNYSYDAEGQLTELTDAAEELIVSYVYDAAGRLIQETNGNGTFTTYEYDAADQLTEITNFATPGDINSSFSYTYDAQGRRIGEVTLDGSWTYGYDVTGQLSSAVFDSANPAIVDQDLQYAYDASGNRMHTVVNGEVTNYNINELNQYETVGNAQYTYDADGNLVQVTNEGNIYLYDYNDENRVVRAETPKGVLEYEYDALGNRTAVIEDGTRTEYLVDPFGSFQVGDFSIELDNVVGEYRSGSGSALNYVHGLGLVSRYSSGEAAYFEGDAIGSVTGLTNDLGGYLNQYVYRPFGTKILSNESISNSFEFVGLLGGTNESSSLSFMRARQYNPVTGRFNAIDPLGLDGGSTNLYQYGFNNPLSFVDPTGEYGWLVRPLIILIGLLIPNTAEGDEPDSDPDSDPGSAPSSQPNDPLVVDLDSDGVELISLDQSNVVFDLNLNGFRESTSWISSNDGFLALDTNNDGIINNISELFGTQSTNGFDELAVLDVNADNIIDANDDQFNDLRIWIDRDQDGFTDTGELRTLAEWDIQSISINDIIDNSNRNIISTGQFTRTDNTQGEIAAVAFDSNPTVTLYDQPFELKSETAFLPNLRGFGQLPNLDIAMSLDSELLGAMRKLVQLDLRNLDTAQEKIEEFLFQWAGVDDIDPSGNGGLADARILSFLEKIFQEEFDFTNFTKEIHYSRLIQSWAQITHEFTSRLAAQGFMRDLFPGSTYNVNSNTLETQTDLATLLQNIQDNLPQENDRALRFWSQAIGVLDAHESSFGLTQESYDETIGAALGSDLGKHLSALRNPIFGTSVKDVLVNTLSQSGSFLNGFSGDDLLQGNKDIDILMGGDGRDLLKGRSGDDYLDGGDGIDQVREKADTNFTLTDTQLVGVGTDTLISIEQANLIGGDSSNVLDASEFTLGRVLMRGGEGDDILLGGFQNDRLLGGDDNDLLFGNMGNDRLAGNLGKDVFAIAVNSGMDIILDFEQGIDTIGLTQGLSFGENGNLDSQIIGNKTILSSNGEVLAKLNGTFNLEDQDFATVGF